MWYPSVTNFYFVVLLQYTFSCDCPVQAKLMRLKGETGTSPEFKDKNQLEVEEYGPNEFLINSRFKGKEAKIQKLFKDTFTVNNINTTESDPLVSESEDYTTDMNRSTRQDEGTTKNIYYSTIQDELTTIEMDTITEIETTMTAEPEYLNTETEINTTTDSEYLVNLPEEENKANVQSDNDTKIEINTSSEVYEGTLQDSEMTSETNLPTESPIQCEKFKRSKIFDTGSMADVWKIAFYTLPRRLKCFKIHVKSLLTEDQLRYEKIYGNFNNSVRWSKCKLEIKTNDLNYINGQRKHFLQTSDLDQGVMENIIIDIEQMSKHIFQDFIVDGLSEDRSSVTLRHESADQWLVLKNLLLMRDCNTGELAIFTRVPLEPRMQDIENALELFGETEPVKGTKACQSNAFPKSGRDMGISVF